MQKAGQIDWLFFLMSQENYVANSHVNPKIPSSRKGTQPI
jgi:hypothetical protein